MHLIWPLIAAFTISTQSSSYLVANYLDEDNPAFIHLPVYPLINEGKYDQAITWLNGAIAKEPKNLTVLECRAHCYHALKKYALAINDFNGCIAMAKKNLYLYYDRGQAYSDLGNYEKALADYETVITLSGNNKDSQRRYYRLKVNALEHLNRNAEAEIWCTKILVIEPKNFEILAKRAALRRKLGRTQDAINDYSAILKSVPDDAVMLKLRGDLYFQLQDWKKAIADYSAAITEEPELAVSIYPIRAKAYAAIGDTAKAATDNAKAKK